MLCAGVVSVLEWCYVRDLVCSVLREVLTKGIVQDKSCGSVSADC